MKGIAEAARGGGERMRKYGNCRLTLLVSVAVCLLSTVLASTGTPISREPPPINQSTPETQAAPVYDGQWWLLLDDDEQTGFVAGYQDCYISEFHGGGIFNKDIPSYVDDLNKYFLADATRQTQTLSEALDKVRGGGDDTPLPAYKAAKPGPKDIPVYDGKFWAEAGASARRGFVEGYLVCHTAKLKDADGKFSKNSSEYAGQITQAYSEQDSSVDTGGEKAGERIGSVLHRFKDPKAAPGKPGS